MKKLKISFFLLALTLCITALPLRSMAAEDGNLVIRNLSEGDVVEVYRIANYEEDIDAYSWASAVQGWLNSSLEGKSYTGLIPAGLSLLTEDKATEFCAQVLMGLKDDEEGTASLVGTTFKASIWKEEYTQDLQPGVYVILPKGKARIYNLKWFVLAPEETVEIEYTDEDFMIPIVNSYAENITEDRGGLSKERIYEGDLSVTDSDYDVPLTYKDDHVKVTSLVTVPPYNRMFSAGKRIYNLTVIVPYGFDYVDESASLYSQGEFESEPLGLEDYILLVMKNVTTYSDREGNLIFYGNEQGFYYEPGGENLISGTIEEALEAYNTLHETDYKLKEPMIRESLAEYSPGEPDTEPEEGDVEGDESGSLAPEEEEIEVTSLGEEENPNLARTLVSRSGVTILLYAIDTKIEAEGLRAEFEIVKNGRSDETGRYPVKQLLTYSVSPLDNNLRAEISEIAELWSYGFRIIARAGKYDTYDENLEEIIEEAMIMPDDVFSFFTFDKKEAGNTLYMDLSDDVYKTYDSENNETLCYKKVMAISVDSNGEIYVAGIEPQEYLIVQTEKTEGYAMSQLTLLVNESVWTDNEDMCEMGNFEVLWLDYPEYSLPRTGSNGRAIFQLVGLLMISIPLVLLCVSKRRRHIVV